MSRLILAREIGEEIIIDGRIVVRVISIGRERVRLAIETDERIPIYRREVLDAIEREGLGGPERDMKEAEQVAAREKRKAELKACRRRTRAR